MIRAAFDDGGTSSRTTAGDWDVVEGVVRPDVSGRGAPSGPRLRGVPTGQPISCVLFNLYLRDLDRELAAVPGGFYARYSDDIVFAHPDPRVVRAADATLRERIAALGLALNEAKGRELYLTAAGHRSSAWPAARGTQHVPLLGLRITAEGTLALDPAKARELVHDIRRRAEAANAVPPRTRPTGPGWPASWSGARWRPTTPRRRPAPRFSCGASSPIDASWPTWTIALPVSWRVS